MKAGEPLIAAPLRWTICRALFVVWILSFLCSSLPSEALWVKVAGGMQLFALIALIAVHASLMVGWWGALVFLLIGYAVGFSFEAASIHTGVPFGWFSHLGSGSKPLGVPLYVPLIYAFAGWLAWALACLLCRPRPTESASWAKWLVPPVGALILTGYDLPYDAIGSAVKGMWIYRTPSGYFGVPLSNYVGWIVTGLMICAIFATVEPRLLRRRAAASATRAYWLIPCMIWGAIALQYPLLLLAAPLGTVIIGSRGFVIADIYESAVIVATLTMLPLSLIGAARVLNIDRTDLS